MSTQEIDVIVPDGYKPGKKERDVAWILARHFCTKVEILRPVNKFKQKTADFLINGVEYELKTPTSSSVDKVQDKIAEGSKQARFIVLDGRRTKILDKRLIKICQVTIGDVRRINRILLITKNHQKIIDIECEGQV